MYFLLKIGIFQPAMLVHQRVIFKISGWYIQGFLEVEQTVCPWKILPAIPKGKEVKHLVFQQNHGFFRGKLLLNFRGCIYLANSATNKNRHDFSPLGCVKFPTSPMVGRMDLRREFVQVHQVQLKAFLWHMKVGSGYGWQTGEAPCFVRNKQIHWVVYLRTLYVQYSKTKVP